jgi:DNA (cytosine-5)-methyltransferase 1
MTTTLKAGALFAGIGGFCLGFEKQNIKTAWAVENELSAVTTYKNNVKDANVLEDASGPLSILNVGVDKNQLCPVDILHAGFPCQSFSMAGERKGFDDPRGMLFYEIIRIINEFGDKKPSVIVLENSSNLKSGDGGRWFLELTKQIKKAGYWFRESNAYELNAYDYTHVPQNRNRLFMIAFSADEFKNGRLDLQLNTNESSKDLRQFIDFEGAIDDDTYYLDENNRYYQMISEKENDPYCIYQLRKYLVRVKEPGVCPTLTANMGLGGHNVPFIFDKKGLRKLTEFECLKLQGFPDWYKFPEEVARAKRYQQVGNSVVPVLVEKIAKAIKQKIELERNK